MVLINLTSIYQGRIPTLNHTQHHAEILARSHLKSILTGELDTHVARLVRELTNQAQRTATNSYPRNKAHTKHTNTTKTSHSTPTPTLALLPRKKMQKPIHTPTPNKPTPNSQTPNPYKRARVITQTTHLKTHRPQPMQPLHT